MALNKKPTFTNAPVLSVLRSQNADGTTLRALVDGGVAGQKVVACFATGEVTADRDVQLAIFDNILNAALILNTVTVPLNSGRDPTIPPVNLLNGIADILPRDADGQPYFFVGTGQQLQATTLTAVTATEQVSYFALHADFDDGVA